MAGVNLKNAEEVKEYLKNLHIEYKFGCYSEKNPEVCHLLGDFTESIKKDFKLAAQLYKTNCDERNYGKSCSKYGGYSFVGKGCKKNLVEGYSYLKKGCELNDKTGCVNAGMVAVSDADTGKQDRAERIAEGIKMLTKACYDQETEKACYHLSGVYLSGIEGYVDKNMKEAYKLSLRACEMRNPYACANVYQMHARGEGVQKNLEIAESFKKRAETLYDEMKNQPQLRFHQGIEM